MLPGEAVAGLMSGCCWWKNYPGHEDTLSPEERNLLSVSFAKGGCFHLLLNRLEIKVARKEIQKAGGTKPPTKQKKTREANIRQIPHHFLNIACFYFWSSNINLRNFQKIKNKLLCCKIKENFPYKIKFKKLRLKKATLPTSFLPLAMTSTPEALTEQLQKTLVFSSPVSAVRPRATVKPEATCLASGGHVSLCTWCNHFDFHTRPTELRPAPCLTETIPIYNTPTAVFISSCSCFFF